MKNRLSAGSTIVIACLAALGSYGTASGDTPSNADSYNGILRTVVGAASMEALEWDAARVAELGFELVGLANTGSDGELGDDRTLGDLGLTLASEERFERGLQQSYRCDAGGSLALMLYDYAGPGTPIEFEADACVSRAATYDGIYRAEGAFETRTSIFDGFSARYADGSEFTIDGERTWVQLRTRDASTLSWTGTDYRLRDASGETRELADLTLTRDGRSKLNDFDGFNRYVSLAAGASAPAVPFALEAVDDEVNIRQVEQSARLANSQWQPRHAGP